MAKLKTYKITVGASTENLSEIRDFVGGHALEYGFDDQKVADIRLAVDEACTNIIKHAYVNDSEENLAITIEVDDEKFMIYLIDRGEGFDVKTYQKPDLKSQIEQKKRGGMGVHLMLNLMDEVTYKVKNNMNVLYMCKNRN